MNRVHVLPQVKPKLEELATGDALVRLLLEMDGLVVAPHVAKVAENLAARRVSASELYTQMSFAIVFHHGRLVKIRLAAGGTLA